MRGELGAISKLLGRGDHRADRYRNLTQSYKRIFHLLALPLKLCFVTGTLILATPTSAMKFAKGFNSVAGWGDHFHQVRLGIVAMVTKNPNPHFLARPAKGHLDDPSVVPTDSHAQVRDVGNKQFKLMVVRVGLGNKAFRFAIHMFMVRNELALNRQNPFFKRR